MTALHRAAVTRANPHLIVASAKRRTVPPSTARNTGKIGAFPILAPATAPWPRAGSGDPGDGGQSLVATWFGTTFIFGS